MIRRESLAVMTGLLMATAALAQAPAWRFHWQPGQVLTYRVEQSTSAAEVIGGKKTETASKLASTKRWQVLAVDPTGVATLQLSLTALRIETTTPSGEVLLFDSADPKGSNPQMREQLSKYVGSPLAVLRVDGLGKVVEVKDTKFGPASRFESEPPFVVTLPERPRPTWERTYKVTLEPPQGTGEKFDAVQTYTARAATDKVVTIGLSTALKTAPAAAADQIPLLQMQPQGEITFDAANGRLEKAQLKVEKDLQGHQGAGSSYHFQSSYSEKYEGDRSK